MNNFPETAILSRRHRCSPARTKEGHACRLDLELQNCDNLIGKVCVDRLLVAKKWTIDDVLHHAWAPPESNCMPPPRTEPAEAASKLSDAI